MAKIGLDNLLYGILTESGGTATYGVAKKPGKAISCNVAITNNDVKLYADNAVAESDTSFQSGTVTLVIDDSDLDTQAELLGHTVTDGEIVRSADDTAPYIGLGRVVTKMVENVRSYKVEFLSKVKFGEPSQEDNTKGENTEFGTTTLEGNVSTLESGEWGKAKVFSTKTDAVAYLRSMFTKATAGAGGGKS